MEFITTIKNKIKLNFYRVNFIDTDSVYIYDTYAKVGVQIQILYNYCLCNTNSVYTISVGKINPFL